MARRGPVELAVWRTLRDTEHVHAAHDGLAATALALGRALDGDAGASTAALARELRATLTALTVTGGDGGDEFEGLLARLSSPVVDTPPP